MLRGDVEGERALILRGDVEGKSPYLKGGYEMKEPLS
jgi:hypothetical protein